MSAKTPRKPAARPGWRRALNAAAIAATIVAIVAWFLLLRPSTLGGATGYVLVVGKSMEPKMRSGDLAIVRASDSYAVGEIVAYHVPEGGPGAGTLVIHRIVGGSATAGYRMQGDNRDQPDFWRPRPSDIEGRMAVHVPGAGRILALLRDPLALATLAALLAFVRIGGRPSHSTKLRDTPPDLRSSPSAG